MPRPRASRSYAEPPLLARLPMWDEDLPPGARFTEEIKRGVAFSQVFVPIITAAANSRPWVHQETRCATALSVRLLPLAVGELPDGSGNPPRAFSRGLPAPGGHA